MHRNLSIFNSKLFWNLLKFSPILFLLAGVNYFVDPAHIFGNGDYERRIARLLLARRNVTQLTNYNDRLVQKAYIAGLARKPEIVVMGSSATFQIGSELFPRKSFFNNGMSVASIADDMALYELYREKNLKPDTVILGLDCWILSGKNPGSALHRLTIEDAYLASAKRAGFAVSGSETWMLRLKAAVEKLSALLSPGYFQMSCFDLLHALKFGPRVPEATVKTADDTPVRLYDGRITWDKQKRTSAALQAGASAMREAGHEAALLGDGMNSLRREQFEKFIARLQEDGVTIIFFLPPYHPYLFNYISGLHHHFVKDEEAYFREFAKSHHIRVIGSYDPTACGLSGADFYDAEHARREAVEKLFRSQLSYER